ncbi:MAG TPA: hypothetical protein VF152_14245 [Acidimicrobiia bacterium]
MPATESAVPAELAAARADVLVMVAGRSARLGDGWRWNELAVLVTAGAPGEEDLLAAARCAVELGMGLRLVHVLDPLVASDLRLRHPRLHFRDDSYVRNLAADVATLSSDAALEVAGELRYSAEPVDAITALLEDRPAVMPFLGTRRRGEDLIERSGLAAAVIERSPSPGLVVSVAERG